jgi:hypothetical protein
VLKCAEEVVRLTHLPSLLSPLIYIFQFRERYILLAGNSDTKPPMQSSKIKKINVLLRELSDDEDAEVDVGPTVPEDPKRPWMRDFHAYIDVHEQVPDGWTTIKWWGVSVHNIQVYEELMLSHSSMLTVIILHGHL